MLANTEEVLFQKNAEKKMSMASTTKIMTALIAVESGRLDDTVTVTDDMIRVEGTSMGLHKGDKLTLHNIVRGMMLLSGNDAANAVAIFLSGSLERFAFRMNEKAKSLGMKNTHFVTPSGLDDKEHYTTAYDMALLSSYAIKNSVFRDCVCDYSGKVEYIYPENTYTYRNHNRFLKMYDGACGIKTGFTKKSGRCLVTAVDRDGCVLVAVTLGAPDDWNDHVSLYNGCLPLIQKKSFDDRFDCALDIFGGDKDKVSASLNEEIKVFSKSGKITTKLLTEKIIYAPVDKGEILGRVRVYVNGKFYADYPVTADECVGEAVHTEKNNVFIAKIKELFGRFEIWLTA